MPNPLAPNQRPPPDHPAMLHAKMWQHVSGMKPDEHESQSAQMDQLLPILGALANNPKVKARDVIRAAADAAATGKRTPSQAVQFITAMPVEPEKLQGWLRGIYEANLSAQVHMKAAMMQQAQGQPQAPPQGGMPV